jgi:exopolysaccharide biosynthesis polyprenyl glycosylphosphotransferase
MVIPLGMVKFSQSVFLYTFILKLADAATVAAVWYSVWYLRFHTDYFSVAKGLPEFSFYSRVSLPLVLLVSALLHTVGAYRSDRIQFGFRAAKKVVEGGVLGTLVFVAVCYFAGEMNYSRVLLALFTGLLILALCLERAAMHYLWKNVLKSSVQKIRVLLVGGGELLDMYVGKIREREPYPVEWVGHVRLGEEDRLVETLQATRPEQVVVSFPEQAASRYGKVLELLSDELVDVKVLPDFGKYSTFTYHAHDECGIPLLAFNQAPVSASNRAFKRMGDVLGATALLLLFSPLYLVLAILVKLSSKGPVFYGQERVGADGSRFRIYKFRTMRTDAEVQSGPVWAIKDDPRTTTIGKWMRGTSLDEIPQFWNVLLGNMSLVGPRPERPEFVEQFKKEIPKYMLRHKMKSGITGWAQVNGWRGNTSLEQRIKHDLYYIGHWSHFFDFKILCLTLLKGFKNQNAY